MPSLKDVKNKISGVSKTKQITKAMNMVASAKLRGAQTRIEQFRTYADRFHSVLHDLAAKADGAAHPLLDSRPDPKTTLVILVTSDRGLCGGFNVSLIACALDVARKARTAGKTVSFICIGKKGRDAIRKSDFPLQSSYVDVLSNFDFSLASAIGKDVVGEYIAGNVDEVFLIYGSFETIARQVTTVLPLLPVQAGKEPEDNQKDTDLAGHSAAEYVYEPDVATLLGVLLPRFVNVQIHRSLLDTAASENAARMMAMDNATRNCDEMTQSLTLLYNKTRQASITSELIDIVGGAEALQ